MWDTVLPSLDFLKETIPQVYIHISYLSKGNYRESEYRNTYLFFNQGVS